MLFLFEFQVLILYSFFLSELYACWWYVEVCAVVGVLAVDGADWSMLCCRMWELFHIGEWKKTIFIWNLFIFLYDLKGVYNYLHMFAYSYYQDLDLLH